MQDTLERLFPTFDTIWKHQEVIKLACGMTDRLDIFLEIIFDRLSTALRSKFLNSDHMPFLEAVGRELPDEKRMDMLHNKYLNYISQDCPTTFIPSKFYEFRSLNLIKDCDYIIKQIDQCDWKNVPPAVCAKTIEDVSSA